MKTCDICHKPKRFVRSNLQLKKLVCPACYVRQVQPWYPCILCKNVGLPAIRTATGHICKACYRYKISVAVCAMCMRSRPSFRRSGVEAICEACSDRYFLVRTTCSFCGRVVWSKGTSASGQPICGACYRRDVKPKRTCSICAQNRIAAIRLENRRSICLRCYFDVTQPGIAVFARPPSGCCAAMPAVSAWPVFEAEP
jgi:hypothetical protein